jgi:transcriptional regulator with PAS, ATPase and Fis domain
MAAKDDLTRRSTLGAVARDRLVALWEDSSVSVDLPARGRVTIGRAEDCDLRIDHASVSRHHAEVHVGDDEARIQDLGSSNGTLLAGRKLDPHRPRALAANTLVTVGDALVVLQLASGAATTRARTLTARSDASAPDAIAHFTALAASCALPVVLLGETGAGKGVLAEAIHRASSRASQALVRLNCAALPEALLESELFGYERGAFTGAATAKPGLLEAASGGTLLLDEIGDLPMATQAKLLHVLEHGEVMRLGSLRPRATDVRFIAATNRDLEALVGARQFRQDLFFRLAGLTMTIAPLRARTGEIPGMARAFLEAACVRVGKAAPEISEAATAKLMAHPWPGNVRELKSAIARVAIVSTGAVVDAADLALGAASFGDASAASVQVAEPAPADEVARLRASMQELERQRIVDALARAAGSQTVAARTLGISRRTLTKKLTAFGLPRPRKKS